MFTEYSLFWIIPIILLAAAASYMLYFYKPKNDFTSPQRYVLASLRFFGLFLILFLLLSPIISYKKVSTQKPLIVIAQDNSQSLVMTKRTAFYRNDYQKALQELIDDLKDDYDVRLVSFGSKAKEVQTNDVHFLFNDYATDISSTLLQIKDSYADNNLAAVILATDGIANKGQSPLNQIDDFTYPIYTVAMGDTTVKKDLLLGDVRCNHTAYMNSQFPIHITALAKKAGGDKSICTITKNGKSVFSQTFNITSDNYSQEFNTTLLAQKAGVEHWRINLAVLKGEQTLANNVKDIFVKVLDSKKRLLIIASAPDADVAAMKQSIQTNENYSIKSIMFNELPSVSGAIKDYDALIVHNMPANSAQMQFLASLKDKKPILYILGDKTQPTYFNSLNTGVQLSNKKSNTLVQATGYLNKNFALFSISDDIENVLGQLPPLNVPYVSFDLSPSAQTLVNQRVGATNTNYPLIAFNSNVSSGRSAVISGEGFWRWRLQNYLINNTFAQVDELFLKTIQYVCSKDEDKNFRVICDNVFAATANVSMSAELYDQSQSLTNTPDVSLTITDSKGKKNQYSFSKTMNAYTFNGGVFAQGEYSFVAQTVYNGRTLTDKGVFFVSSESLEGENLVADHNLLFTLSEHTGAKMVSDNNIAQLKKLITQNKNIKPLLHQSIEDKRLLDSWWYLLVILLCFSAEWFLRKYLSA